VSKQNSMFKGLTTFISMLSTLVPAKPTFNVLFPQFFLLLMVPEPLDKDVAEEFPSIAAGFEDFQKTFCVSLDIPGQTCVYLASGKGKHALKGKYFDCEQDIQTVVDHTAEIQKEGLYELEVRFLGGLPNDGGTAKM